MMKDDEERNLRRRMMMKMTNARSRRTVKRDSYVNRQHTMTAYGGLIGESKTTCVNVKAHSEDVARRRRKTSSKECKLWWIDTTMRRMFTNEVEDVKGTEGRETTSNRLTVSKWMILNSCKRHCQRKAVNWISQVKLFIHLTNNLFITSHVFRINRKYCKNSLTY